LSMPNATVKLPLLLTFLLVGCSSSPSPNPIRRGPAPLSDGSTYPKDATTDTILVDLAKRPADLLTPPLDSSPELPTDLLMPDSSADLLIDLSPDLTFDTTTDVTTPNADTTPILKRDTGTSDLPPNLPLGTTCIHNSDCHSSYCTNGVCCEVAVCTNPCTPYASNCVPYNGFTCAPNGTCRGY